MSAPRLLHATQRASSCATRGDRVRLCWKPGGARIQSRDHLVRGCILSSGPPTAPPVAMHDYAQVREPPLPAVPAVRTPWTGRGMVT